MGFEEKLIQGMLARGYSQEFAERLFAQICGFGEYGFPESHSASFANLAYVSAWLKRHCPAAFYVGLLNSQPMGFYTASQLVQDARRHQVEILPISINTSNWDHQLQKSDGEPAIRLGFRLIKGLAKKDIEALLARRPTSGFADMVEFEHYALASSLSGSAQEQLASANAFAELSGNRYQTRWDTTKLGEQLPLLAGAETQVGDYALAAPSELADMQEDYSTTGLTLGRHPLAILNDHDVLPKHRKASELTSLRAGQLVTVIGLVTNRQRPGTASGVTFMTLEDESGTINIVLWQDLARRQRRQWMKARLLQVKGILEMEGDVIHIVAGDMRDLSGQLPIAQLKSRDFH